MVAHEDTDLDTSLARLTLSERLPRQEPSLKVARARGLSSQYQCNYQPLELGVRKVLWEEGFKHRNVRKQAGFKHTKLEWKIITDRSQGAATARIKTARKSSGPLIPAIKDTSGLEPLNLPPTKLHKKRQRLRKIYERQRRKLLEQQEIRPKTATFTDGKNVEIRRPRPKKGEEEDFAVFQMTSYDRNKSKNMKSNVALPTASTDTTPSSATASEERFKEVLTTTPRRRSKEVQTSARSNRD